MGHSLGGKMAFYAGCLDPRFRAIVASDFGLAWDSSNWGDAWYFGDKLKAMRADGLSQEQLLARYAPAFCPYRRTIRQRSHVRAFVGRGP